MTPPRTTRSAEQGRPRAGPPPAPRAIFRPEALQQYIRNQERVVLPRLVTPRAFRWLWLLAVLTMIVGLAVAFWPWADLLPAFLPGVAP